MIHIQPLNTSIGLSPVMLYHLNTSSLRNDECNFGICSYQYHFHWHGDEMCHLTMICSHLGPHICADHGLSMKTSDSELNNICHQEQIYQANVSKISTVSAKVWYTLNANLDMSCYIWCDDALHKYHLDHSVPNSNHSRFMKEIQLTLEDHPKLQPLSSGVVYQLNLTENSLETCKAETEKCFQRAWLKWFSPYPCEVNVQCNYLMGNICGDYGPVLSMKDHLVNICQPDQNYNELLQSMDTMEMQFWYTEDNGPFNVSCKLWCQQEGNGLAKLNENYTVPKGT